MAATRGDRTFEDFEPKVEWLRADEADAVKFSLPGFKREDIRVLVDNHGNLRTRGERPLGGSTWSRFQKDFKLPDNCNFDGIRAKFESETLTITLPKKTPSPQAAPVQPPVPEPRRPAAAAPQKPPPPAVPEPPKPAPPQVPAAPLAPASSQRQPAAERRPSLPRKPSAPPRLPSVPTPPEVESPKKFNGGAAATSKPAALAAVPKPTEQEPVTAAKKPSLEEEEAKRMEREAMGKMEEDRKAAQEKAEKEKEEAAAMGEMEMAHRPRPVSASRGLLVNVAVAVVVLVGITVYVWHTLRSAAGDHGRGETGATSYGDEM